jgi:hypothetical protein
MLARKVAIAAAALALSATALARPNHHWKHRYYAPHYYYVPPRPVMVVPYYVPPRVPGISIRLRFPL